MQKIWSIFFLIAFTACSQGQVQPTATLTIPPSPQKSTPAAQDTTPKTAPVTSSVPTRTSRPTSTNTPTPTRTLSPTFTATPLSPVAGIETNNPSSAEIVDILAGSGAAWVRYPILEWNSIEPVQKTPPEYLWSQDGEQAMRLANEAGLEVIGVVKFAPDWAQKIPGVACGPIAESALERFAMFMYEAVRRYSQPPYEIKYWEIGNEVDVASDVVPPQNPYGCWGDRSDMDYGGGYYAEVLKAVYPQIKLADPQAQVLVGGLLMDCDPVNPPKGKDCASTRFMEGILKNSGGGYFDGISFHAYDYYYLANRYGNPNWASASDSTGPAFLAKINYLKNLLQQYNQPAKYLMLTEVALLCRSTGIEPECQSDDFLQTKRAYIIQALVEAKIAGLRSVVWYSLEGWRASGLLRGRSIDQPAYQAFQTAAGFIADAQWQSNLDLYPKVMVIEFLKSGKRFWVIWNMSDKTGVTINLPKTPAVIYNSIGVEQPPTTVLTLDFEPVFVEWKD